MTWFNGMAVYVVTWWVVLFMVLPWGARPPESPQIGHASGAPERPMMWRKVAITTVVAAGVWLVIDLIILSEWISFRDLAARMGPPIR